MAGIGLSNISKSFGATPILKTIDLDIADGEFLTLLGPSGCGKSTLLRILAGLESQDQGSVTIAGVAVDGMRPKQRDIAMVFQSYALYPHMTVAANMALPLEMRRLTAWQRLPVLGRLLPGTVVRRREIDAEVALTAVALGIDHLLGRKPGQISGGQRQRVAVGRAMVRHPAVFLMDEPLSNLDAKLRVQMRAEIKALHQRLGVTFIYVTHDQAEAMTLSDRVAVMFDGEIAQIAPPQEIYADPNERRIAEFIGSPAINMLPAIAGSDHTINAAGTTLAMASGASAGQRLTIGIRPEAFSLVERPASGTIRGRLRLMEHMGSDVFVHLEVAGTTELVIARLLAERTPHLHAGQELNLAVKADRVLLFSQDGKRLRQESSVAAMRETA